MDLHLYSGAARVYERCKKIKPRNSKQRERMYESAVITEPHLKVPGETKFSPFNTISRGTRNSFLLKVTTEINTQTNYDPNPKANSQQSRRPTIDKAPFKRIIGPVNFNDYSVELNPSKTARRCKNAFQQTKTPRPLTARETHKWRKSNQHLDFSKQTDPGRSRAKSQSNCMQATKQTINSHKNTSQQNFNNFKRYSMELHNNKIHDFHSHSGHEYLKGIQKKKTDPQYDISSCREQFLRKSFRKNHGQLRFSLFRDLIKTRLDRSDPHWMTNLDYNPQNQSIDAQRKNQTIDFNQTLNRQNNQVHSKYPLRQCLKTQVPNNYRQ